MTIYENLQRIGITLPNVPAPAGAYVRHVQVGNLLFLSGHIARRDGGVWVGKLGESLAVEDGKSAARSVAIDLLATLQAATDNLDRVKRIVKIMVLVNSTSSFCDQHLVANGASELFAEVFGDRGVHARSAFGVAQIPLGACVEIEMVVEVE